MMKKGTKAWLIVAGSLVIIGALLFGAVMSANKWDFQSLDRSGNNDMSFDINDDFVDISILSSTEDISILPSLDGKCKVVLESPMTGNPQVTVQDGRLYVNTVSSDGMKNWFDDIQFFASRTPTITVYLPKNNYSEIAISESTGGIDICDLSAGDLRISVTTGDVKLYNIACDGDIEVNLNTGETELKNVTCTNLASKGTTGDIKLDNVRAGEKISIERGTGNVTLNQSDAGELQIATSTGDVTGNLLSDKIFNAKSDTGDIDVPASTPGGKCTITTSTGDIDIDIN